MGLPPIGHFNSNEGGRSLNPTNSTGSLFPNIDLEDLKSVYFQDFHNVSRVPYLHSTWALPVEPTKGPQHGPHPIAARYYNSYLSIMTSWGCNVSDCIPQEFRMLTPYSLALLSSLGKLARRSRNCLEVIQAELAIARDQRLRQLHIDEKDGPNRFVETTIPEDTIPNCEPVIMENVFGLTISDVKQVLECRQELEQTLRAHHKRNKTRKEAVTRKIATQDVARRILKFTRDERRKPRKKRALPPSGLFSNSKFGKHLYLWKQGRQRHLESDAAVVDQSLNDGQSMDVDMVELMSTVDLHKSPKEEELKHLEHKAERGGESHIASQNATLPSEKIDLDLMPSLQDMMVSNGLATQMEKVGIHDRED